MRSRLLVLGICGAMFAVAAPAAPDDIAGIAQVIREQYFDPDRARTIADEMQTRARAQSIDRLPSRDEVAQRLTGILHPFDHHFRVTYEPQAGGVTDGSPGPEKFLERVRASNYGFRKVEMLPGGVGFIELSLVAHIDFGDAHDPAKGAADAALGQVRDAKAVILDLRGNGGGSPAMVGYVVSAFVEPRADVYNTFHSREGTSSERPTVEYPHPHPDVPLFVLTNHRTGSAAESIAYTLQSCGRATVVGERTAGAANPGDLFRTPEGYAVFVSTGSPRNPVNGRNWEKTGVAPDVVTPADQALERALELAARP